MLEIDGSVGGGQLVRWALGFATVDGTPVKVTGVRGSRSNPGLRPQHLAAVELFAELTDAETSGVEEDSRRFTFDPGPVRPGEYAVDIGTAGSVTLLFDAVLSLAPVLDGPVSVTATGGTDVKWSPTMAYYQRVKLPSLRQSGLLACVDVDRRGFYPAGGGRATLRVAQSAPTVDLIDRRPIDHARVVSVASRSLSDDDVARRQRDAAVEALDDRGIAVEESVVTSADAYSPGSVVCVRLDCGPVPVGFDALGERGKPAEDVGSEAVDAATEWVDATGVVDPHMADQLVPFLALVGGRVAIPAVTDHVETGVELARTFGHDVGLDDSGATPILRGSKD